MRVFGLQFNLANVWGLPLIIGTSAEFGLNVMMRYLEGRDQRPLVARSTVMAVVAQRAHHHGRLRQPDDRRAPGHLRPGPAAHHRRGVRPGGLPRRPARPPAPFRSTRRRRWPTPSRPPRPADRRVPATPALARCRRPLRLRRHAGRRRRPWKERFFRALPRRGARDRPASASTPSSTRWTTPSWARSRRRSRSRTPSLRLAARRRARARSETTRRRRARRAPVPRRCAREPRAEHAAPRAARRVATVSESCPTSMAILSRCVIMRASGPSSASSSTRRGSDSRSPTRASSRARSTRSGSRRRTPGSWAIPCRATWRARGRVGMRHVWLVGRRAPAAPCCPGDRMLRSLGDLEATAAVKPERPARAGGIIAAGDGSRLRRDGFASAEAAGARGRRAADRGRDRELPRRGHPLPRHHRERETSGTAWTGCATRFPELDTDFIVKTTASSLESFRRGGGRAGGGRMLVSTVDAWCRRGGLRALRGGGRPAAARRRRSSRSPRSWRTRSRSGSTSTTTAA